MEAIYQDKIYNADCLDVLKEMPSNSIDLVCTDPPYGISFMGKSWDKALPGKQIWEECLRVLKSGAFAFVMSIPRADCLSRMIISLEDAGFVVNFTPIFWAYASGFPKAQNIGKAVDKRLGVEREIIGINQIRAKRQKTNPKDTNTTFECGYTIDTNLTLPATPQAKALDGSYGGFQVKPAVEVIIVAMKPLSEKTYVDQALKNGKGITWLDEGRIPYESKQDFNKGQRDWQSHKSGGSHFGGEKFASPHNNVNINMGRFPANLLCSDDVLNDGKITRSRESDYNFGDSNNENPTHIAHNIKSGIHFNDSGSFSRYFDLDKWWTERIKQLPVSVQKTFPFLIVSKASKSEKNKGCEDMPEVTKVWNGQSDKSSTDIKDVEARWTTKLRNNHPTVKPLKLMSYLIILGSREGDIVLDPFMGSGTTALSCQLLRRHYIGSEINKEYYEIAMNRLSQSVLI